MKKKFLVVGFNSGHRVIPEYRSTLIFTEAKNLKKPGNIPTRVNGVFLSRSFVPGERRRLLDLVNQRGKMVIMVDELEDIIEHLKKCLLVRMDRPRPVRLPGNGH